ncbi:MAG: TetR/AcrR family transcriptional regulator [Clostridiales bacterium]|nr:TetR/AcrR family transcriptional regulator [Clostridiales bacterium]
MPFSRFDQVNEEKKTIILETALDAFIENSFKVASINKISKNAGLSAGALYYYFQDKEDLFNTTLDYAQRELWNLFGEIETLFETYGYWEGITELVLKRFELNITHPRYMKLFQRVLLSKDAIELEGRNKLMKGFNDIFEYGYKHGYIRTDLPKEFLFSIHFNMTITINQWLLQDNENLSSEELHINALKELSIKAVNMIKSAMTDEEA